MSASVIAKAQGAMNSKIQSAIDPVVARLAVLEASVSKSAPAPAADTSAVDEVVAKFASTEEIVKMLDEKIGKIEERISEITASIDGILAIESDTVVETKTETDGDIDDEDEN